MALGAILSVAAPIVGNLIGSKLASDRSSAEALDNRIFQEQQSSTSYQRAVKDLQLAGLNPALAYQQGGASTSAGSMGQSFNPELGQAASQGMSAARERERLDRELDLMDSEIRLKSTQSLRERETAYLTNQQLKNEQLTTAVLQANLPAVKAESEARQSEAKARKKHGDIDSKLAPIDAGLNRVGNLGSAIGNVLKPKVNINKTTPVQHQHNYIRNQK